MAAVETGDKECNAEASFYFDDEDIEADIEVDVPLEKVKKTFSKECCKFIRFYWISI